jgi:hypothetical protein
VFVTEQEFTGDLGGLQGADDKCQAAASNAGLSGTYKAWLSDSSTSVAARFVNPVGPYVLTDGNQIAGSWADLTDGGLARPIDINERGVNTVGFSVWTYTIADGSAVSSGDNCSNWTLSGSDISGENGNPHRSDVRWSLEPGTVRCDAPLSLYCFQQSE